LRNIKFLIIVLSVAFGALCASSFVKAAGSSASYRLDWNRVVNDAGVKSSPTYRLEGAVPSISANGNSASYNLRNVYPVVAAVGLCGNGAIDAGEQCDGANLNGKTCADYGETYGTLSCTALCQISPNCWTPGGGYTPSCGNSIFDPAEQCDDGNLTSGDGCNSVCRVEYAACGNGIKEIGEECDDGNNHLGDGCTPACEVETVCGNGIREFGEECDDGNKISSDGCSATCTIERAHPTVCGNGIKETGEQCDDGNVTSGDGCSAACQYELPERPPIVFPEPTPTPTPTPVTEEIMAGLYGIPSLRPAAPEFPLGAEFYTAFRKGGRIEILDETPFVVAYLEPDQDYQMVAMGEGDMCEAMGRSDKNGLAMFECEKRVKYGNYDIRVHDMGDNVVLEIPVTIVDYAYKQQYAESFNGADVTETIDLGQIEKSGAQAIRGFSRAFNAIYAYIVGDDGVITALKTWADKDGNYSLALPSDMELGKYRAEIVEMYQDKRLSRNKHYAFELVESNLRGAAPAFPSPVIPALMVMVLGTFLMLLAYAWIEKINPGKFLKRRIRRFERKYFAILLALCLTATMASPAFALVTTPNPVIYEGKLLNTANLPITTNQTFRFSLWNTSDLVAGDINGVGGINPLAPAYGGWNEVQSVVPNSDGTFMFELGKVTPVPDFLLTTHTNLQVEIKIFGAPDTAYELMDPTGDNGVDVTDRQTIGSAPYANNADYIDNKEIGMGAGNIAILGAVGPYTATFDVGTIPGGTNADTFVLDADNTVVAPGAITLQFGTFLAQTLQFDILKDWFAFNNDVSINSNNVNTGPVLTLGNTAGDIQMFRTDATPETAVTGSIGDLAVDSTGGAAYLKTSGAATNTGWSKIITSPVGWADIATRVKEMVFNTDYADATPTPDGTTNKGILDAGFEDLGGTAKRTYYEWTTTQAALQNIDVVISWKLPLDFASFTGTPIRLTYETTDGNIANAAVDMSMFDTTGAAVVLGGPATGLANGSWTTANITIGGGPTFTAGDTVTLRLKLSAKTPNFARVSTVVLEYNGQ